MNGKDVKFPSNFLGSAFRFPTLVAVKKRREQVQTCTAKKKQINFFESVAVSKNKIKTIVSGKE